MLRKIWLVSVVCLLASLSAGAEDDKVEVFGGYSYLHFHNSPSISLNGWEASVQYRFTDWLGGVADFDGHYGSLHGAGTSTYTYLFGPQVSWPARVSPFGHLLLGGASWGGWFRELVLFDGARGRHRYEDTPRTRDLLAHFPRRLLADAVRRQRPEQL